MIRLFKDSVALTKRERFFLNAALGITILAVLYVYLVEPRAKRWMELEEELQDALRQHAKLSLLVEHEDEIRGRYARLKKTFASKGTESADAIDFFQFLGTLDTGTSFRVYDIRPVLTRDTDQQLKKTQVVIFCEASIEGLEQFLQRIASAEQALRPEKLTVSLARPGTPWKVTANISRMIRRD